MPIIDYQEMFEKDKKRFFDSEEITQANKDAMTDFLEVYTKKAATKSIMLQRMREFLSHFKDIRKDMQDYDKVVKVLAKLAHKGTFETYRNKSSRFVKLLNRGIAPEPFQRAWKQFDKNAGGREIKTENLLKWEEALELIKHTSSTQIKAVLMTQLDAGLRPSEFVDLNYGDVKQKGRFLIIHVEESKTGKPRDVECWRCSPWLNLWLRQHPTKKNNDPLWVQEQQNGGEIKRYEYAALKRRISTLNTVDWNTITKNGKTYKKVKNFRYDKPMDFYALRHGSCFLDKEENIPTDIAAHRHGHDYQFFLKVYGKEDSNSRMKRINSHQGLEEEKEKKIKEKRQGILCKICDVVNEQDEETCVKCNSPLTMKKALEQDQGKDKEIEKLKKQIEDMPKMILELLQKKGTDLESLKVKN